MVWRACRTASAVTAQVLMTTVSPSALARRAANHLGLIGIEPAAEGDDIDAHVGTCSNSAGSNLPSNSNSAGPVIST